jgi:mannose-6-phosphate isomerase-like protein (cupin superfamily)
VPVKPFYLPPSAPPDSGLGGINIRTLIRSSQTNMQFSSVEAAVAPKTMDTATQVHKEADEIMLVLEGTATVWVDDAMEEMPASVWHIAPGKFIARFGMAQTNR